MEPCDDKVVVVAEAPLANDLTLRQLFASAALNGLLSGRHANLPTTLDPPGSYNNDPRRLAHLAVRYADALLEKLNEP